jgi:hypothetical protein
MNLDNIPKKKRILVISLLLLPLLISILLIVSLKIMWRVEIAPGEFYSPVENVPLFTGLIIFTFGYLFFLGMLFSENIMEMFNKRRSLSQR